MSKIHGMIDLETLGVSPDSVIMTLGAIKFNPWGTEHDLHDPLYLRGDIEEQTTVYNRTIDDNTIAWWQKQDQSVIDEAFGDHDRVDLDSLTTQLNKWCVGLDVVWAQGPSFDIVMLENLYKNVGKPVPWNFWQIRDSRTLFSLMPKDPRKDFTFEAHNALEDCKIQAKCVQQSFRHLKVLPR